jgi:hypothetical protein
MNCAENVALVHSDFFVIVLVMCFFYICLQPLGPSFFFNAVIEIGWVYIFEKIQIFDHSNGKWRLRSHEIAMS